MKQYLMIKERKMKKTSNWLNLGKLTGASNDHAFRKPTGIVLVNQHGEENRPAMMAISPALFPILSRLLFIIEGTLPARISRRDLHTIQQTVEVS
jgi:hypothetical protein